MGREQHSWGFWIGSFFMYFKRKENRDAFFFFWHVELCFLKYQPGFELRGPMTPIGYIHLKKLCDITTDIQSIVVKLGFRSTGFLILRHLLPCKTTNGINRTCLVFNKQCGLLLLPFSLLIVHSNLTQAQQFMLSKIYLYLPSNYQRTFVQFLVFYHLFSAIL